VRYTTNIWPNESTAQWTWEVLNENGATLGEGAEASGDRAMAHAAHVVAQVELGIELSATAGVLN
jgi:hypothetical protein